MSIARYTAINFATQVINEKHAILSETETILDRLEYEQKMNTLISDRSRELLFQMIVKDYKLETLMDRLKATYPAEAVNIEKLKNDVSNEYDNDQEWMKTAREHAYAQPILPDETKSRKQERTQTQQL